MVPERLRALRLAHGLSIPALAAAIDLTADFLYKLEAGRRSASPRTIAKVAAYFHVSVELLSRPLTARLQPATAPVAVSLPAMPNFYYTQRFARCRRRTVLELVP